MAAPPPPPSGAPFRRRIIVIKRALQMKFVALVAASVLVTAAVVALDVYYVAGKLLIRQFGGEALGPIVKDASLLLAAHMAVFACAAAVIAVFMSHQLAGPVFRLEQIAEAVAAGDLSVRAKFREGDEFFETAEHINKMLGALHRHAAHDRDRAAKAAALLDDIAAGFKSGKLKPEDAAARLVAMAADLRGIGTEFKL